MAPHLPLFRTVTSGGGVAWNLPDLPLLPPRGEQKCLLALAVDLLGWGFSGSHSAGLLQGAERIPGEDDASPEVGAGSANKEDPDSKIGERNIF